MPQMTHRERILAAIDHKPLDRVPLDYWGVPEITSRLFEAVGAKNYTEFARKLDLDYVVGVGPDFVAKDRPNMHGVNYKIVRLPGGSGSYEEPERLPIEHCETIDEIDACYTFPSTDMFDYSTIARKCKEGEGFALSGGYISLTYFYECIRGTEQMCIDFAARPEVADYILERLQQFHHAHVANILDAAGGKIDITQVTDDFGTQSGLLISPGMIDRYFGRYYEDNIALAKSYGARVFHHDDGAMTAMLPWLMEKGIEVLNPLQWHLPGWNLADLKAEYAGRLCFHGGIDNQFVLPFGTPQQVRQEVNACCEALLSDGTGYILAPCHNVQAITPVENVLEMYSAAKQFRL